MGTWTSGRRARHLNTMAGAVNARTAPFGTPIGRGIRRRYGGVEQLSHAQDGAQSTAASLSASRRRGLLLTPLFTREIDHDLPTNELPRFEALALLRVGHVDESQVLQRLGSLSSPKSRSL